MAAASIIDKNGEAGVRINDICSILRIRRRASTTFLAIARGSSKPLRHIATPEVRISSSSGSQKVFTRAKAGPTSLSTFMQRFVCCYQKTVASFDVRGLTFSVVHSIGQRSPRRLPKPKNVQMNGKLKRCATREPKGGSRTTSTFVRSVHGPAACRSASDWSNSMVAQSRCRRGMSSPRAQFVSCSGYPNPRLHHASASRSRKSSFPLSVAGASCSTALATERQSSQQSARLHRAVC